MPADPLLTPAQLRAVLQGARKAQNLTQAELASRVGMSQSRVSHLELNPAQFNVGQLLRVCAALGLELTIGARGQTSAAAVSGEDW